MPEGHTIHRYARLHRRRLRGRPVAVTSPQGRFDAGAARLDGGTVTGVDAVGKHLFYRWADDQTLHIHLGLFGRFRTHTGAPPRPTDGTRLAMETDDATIYLSGPTACEIVTHEEEQAIRARLGPDPLDRRADPVEFATNLSRRTIPIAAALLDQKVVAGIGNVYRAELLFLTAIPPLTRSRDLGADEVERLWDRTVAELRRGEKAGRIVTTDPADFGAARDGDLRRDERLWVYKRDGRRCRRCGTEIATTEVANRSLWWCPTCQAG